MTALDETKVTCFYSASLAEPIDGVTLSVGNGQGPAWHGGVIAKDRPTGN